MEKLWIVVAEHAGAKIYDRPSARPQHLRGPLEHRVGSRPLRLVSDLPHPEGSYHDRDRTSDRPGRMVSSHGKDIRHSLAHRESASQHDAEQFAKHLALQLERAHGRNEFRSLILIAAPEFLGILKSKLHPSTARCVVETLDQDFSALSSVELTERLAPTLLSLEKAQAAGA